MRQICLLITVLKLCSGFFCQTPQRVGYMSYSTLLDYDNLAGLFETMTTQINKSECLKILSENSTYSLTNIQPHIYYSDSQQTISFLDVYTANVTGGHLYYHLNFNYEIVYGNGSTLEGTGQSTNQLDEFWFTKSLLNQRGELLWKTNKVNSLVLRDAIFVSSSTPKLPFDDKLQIESILNGNSETKCEIKSKSMSEINSIYFADLESWLLNEHLMSSTNIVYKYSFDKSIEYMNHPYEFGLNEKGLAYQFQFEVENLTTECAFLNDTFDAQYGGNQEKIAMAQVKASALKMVKQGWLNRDMTFDWEIPEFQFYMGDLGNYIQKAKDLIPSKPFEVSCTWNNSLYDIIVQKQQKNQLYVTIPYFCTFTLDNKQIQTLSLGVGMIVTITASKQNLIFKIGPKTGVVGPIFTEIDGYKITSFSSATELLKRVVASTIGSKTFGTGFPINYRDQPAIVIQEEYVLIFDAAEPY